MSDITDKTGKIIHDSRIVAIIGATPEKGAATMQEIHKQICEVVKSITDKRKLKIILQFILGIKGSS